MRSSRHSGRQKRQTDRTQAEHPQRDGGHSQNHLYIIGIGPGALAHLSPRADEVLQQVDTIAGYHTYIELIRPRISDQHLIRTGMTREVERVSAAVEAALKGRTCAIVCSGDPGIYAMAGLVFEMCKEKKIQVLRPLQEVRKKSSRQQLTVEVIPGIPALCAGAALLGAPLTHDFAVISLSDLLTPWTRIAARLEAAAQADFVIVIYNPKSRRRSEQLGRAQQILLRHRDGRTPVGVVRRAMRSGQQVQLTTLAALHRSEVDMQTTLFVGSSQSFQYLDFMVTPRGYAGKYDLKNRPTSETTTTT